MTPAGDRYFHGDAVLGEWFPRQGDNLILRAEKIDQNLGAPEDAKLTITVFTKNSDDQGEGTVVSTAAGKKIEIGNETATIQTALIVSTTDGTEFGLKELVRLKYVVSDSDAGDWFLIRTFPPLFFDNADGTAT